MGNKERPKNREQVAEGREEVEGERIGGRDTWGWKGDVDEGVESAESCCEMGSSRRRREERRKERRTEGV